LTGLNIEEKGALVERALWDAVPGGRAAFEAVDVTLARTDKPDPRTNEEAAAVLRITVKDPDERKVGRAFSSRVTELSLSSYPGLYGSGLTAGASAYGVFWPTLVPSELVWQEVVVGDRRTVVDPVLPPDPPVVIEVTAEGAPEPTSGPTRREPLGRIFGARSGDKGGNANLGVWAPDDASYQWLRAFLTTDQLRSLLPETAPLRVERHELANLRAVNFVIFGLLGEGVAATTRLDGQAKSLGEWLRARVVDVPVELLRGP
jgi:hypothetical protein